MKENSFLLQVMTEETKRLGQIFTEDHKIIDDLLKNYANLLRRDLVESIPSLLKKLLWEINRHFYIEEKSFTVFAENKEKFDENFYTELIKQHDTILSEIHKIGSQKGQAELEFLENLIDKLHDHVTFESEYFYLTLDQIVNDQKRQKLIALFQDEAKKGYFPLGPLRKFITENIMKH